MDRYTRIHKAKLDTQLLQEEYDAGVEFVNKLHLQRNKIKQAVEKEVQKQKELREKIQFLKAERNRVEKANRTQAKLFDKAQNDRTSLEIEAESYTKNNETKLSALTSQTVKNNFPELIVHLNRGDLPTEKSILLTCLGKFIRTMAENEFEEHNWTAKISENGKGVAGRIRFDAIFMTEADIKLIYKPVVQELGKRFSRSGLQIQTKTGKKNGVITVVDLIVRVPSRIREAGLELP